MFFAAADKFLSVSADKNTKVVILRMSNVPAMDVSALRKLEEVYRACKRKNITLLVSHVNEQPRRMMEKAGFAGCRKREFLREHRGGIETRRRIVSKTEKEDVEDAGRTI